ncbi:Ubiquitin carboxyl-terminal hydrolase 11 [Orchesella cincta]|uniref:ubiquitinyl hydrolase 1 n=1 Tax=Orchesella cincta TaxID=48709 RepID=A0A1D2MJM1_ORCCI|nr:Ubiquitin carboxyl-terminal hydrolase 11 [Orchesella cincta]
MTLRSSPYPKESAVLTMGQAIQEAEVAKIKEMDSGSSTMPSSATSFVSDGSEDAGFEDGPIDVDVDMNDEETEGIQIDCIQTLTEFDSLPDSDPNFKESSGSPIMSDCKTAIPLPAPPLSIGSAYGGNQAYNSFQSIIPRTDRPTSPITSYWNDIPYSGSSAGENRDPSRAPGDVGLNNIGNTCFMNSGLQCLLHTSPLVEFFVESDTFEKTISSLVYQFHSLMKHAWFGYAGAISLHDFKLVLGNKYAQFKDCRQHDCQEFLAVLLDILHEELKLKQKAHSADSSVGESYIEDCSSALSPHPDQSVCSTSKDKETSVIGSSSETENDTVTKSSTSSTSANTLNSSESVCSVDELDHCSHDVKRKSAVGIRYETGVSENNEAEESVKEAPESNEVDESVNDKTGNEAEVPESNEVDENVQDGNGNEAEGSQQEILSPVQKAQEYWEKYMKENNTVVASTFQGMFKSAVTCSECSFISETFEPFMYLSLPIPRVMEKQLSVTFISMKDRCPVKVDLTLHLMGSVEKLIQETVKKVDSTVWDDRSKYAAAEVLNYRVARVLDEKQQLRNLSTNNRNIYVFELNDNFDEKYGSFPVSDNPYKYGATGMSVSSSADQGLASTSLHEDWETDDTCPQIGTVVSTSNSSTYGDLRAPVGGGAYDGSSCAFGPSVSSSSDTPVQDNDNFNRVQCNICLEDYPKSDLKQHVGCSCVLCEECLMKSVDHYKTSEPGDKGKAGTYIKCAVCLQTVECKRAFLSLEELSTSTSPTEFITMPILFKKEPGTDANNNAAWSSGLFGYPWLIRVPSHMNASELVEYVESIIPAPDVTHRLLSVKSDAKNCGQCVYSSRCDGCEIPREGMISLNSCNSILISYTDLSSDRMSEMQPSDMSIQNELNWQHNRNEEPTIDIHDCLRTFSETEHLDEQNPWYCPRCKKNQRATKALSICKFPDYLIVYLKRFVFMDQSSNKLNNRLTFPVNDLDVSDYVTEGFGSNLGKYDLYSCVCHFGSASSGHYTAFARNPVTNQWHYFNDNTISERTPAEAEYASAYVLFYEKQGMVCNIPSKCSGPLPELNSFNSMTSTSYTGGDTRGSYLPDDPIPAGPVRMDGDFINEVNLQVDSTSPSFTFPHVATEADLLAIDVDEGVGNETSQMTDIRETDADELSFSEHDSLVVTSTSTADDGIKHLDEALGLVDPLATQDHELSSSCTCTGSADSTSLD